MEHQGMADRFDANISDTMPDIFWLGNRTHWESIPGEAEVGKAFDMLIIGARTVEEQRGHVPVRIGVSYSGLGETDFSATILARLEPLLSLFRTELYLFFDSEEQSEFVLSHSIPKLFTNVSLVGRVSLSPDVPINTTITSLSISSVKFPHGLPQLGKLERLRKLHISPFSGAKNSQHENEFWPSTPSSLPFVSTLRELQAFTLHECARLQHPPQFFSPAHLTHLDLNSCPNLSAQIHTTLSSCTNIRNVHLRGIHSLENVNWAQFTPLLETVDVGGCARMTSISALRSCSNLTELIADHCPGLIQTDGLSSCSNLRTVDFSFTDVPNKNTFVGLCNITHFVFSGSKWTETDFWFLTENRQLESIVLRHCPHLRNVRFLCMATRLISVDISSSKKIQHMPLGHSVDLEVLCANYTRTCDLEEIMSCRNLRHLDLRTGIQVKWPEHISRMPELNTLFLHAIKHWNLVPLSSCSCLRVLQIARMPDVTSIEPLAQCYVLEILRLGFAPGIKEIGSVSTLPGLRELVIAFGMDLYSDTPSQEVAMFEMLLNGSTSTCFVIGDETEHYVRLVGSDVTGIDAVAACRRLEKLVIAGLDRVETVNNVGQCRNLTSFAAIHCGGLKDCSGLKSCSSLRSFFVDGCQRLPPLSHLRRDLLAKQNTTDSRVQKGADLFQVPPPPPRTGKTEVGEGSEGVGRWEEKLACSEEECELSENEKEKETGKGLREEPLGDKTPKPA